MSSSITIYRDKHFPDQAHFKVLSVFDKVVNLIRVYPDNSESHSPSNPIAQSSNNSAPKPLNPCLIVPSFEVVYAVCCDKVSFQAYSLILDTRSFLDFKLFLETQGLIPYQGQSQASQPSFTLKLDAAGVTLSSSNSQTLQTSQTNSSFAKKTTQQHIPPLPIDPVSPIDPIEIKQYSCYLKDFNQASESLPKNNSSLGKPLNLQAFASLETIITKLANKLLSFGSRSSQIWEMLEDNLIEKAFQTRTQEFFNSSLKQLEMLLDKPQVYQEQILTLSWLDLKSLTKLIGLGMGLTPSGDDYFVGLLASLENFLPEVQLETNQELLKLFEQIAQGTRTNKISATQIILAGSGFFKTEVLELVKALELTNPEEQDSCKVLEEQAYQVTKLCLKLLEIGATSGRDILLGIYDSLRLVQALQNNLSNCKK